MKKIILKGTTYLNKATCLCGTSISAQGIVETVRCTECGATFEKLVVNIVDKQVEVEYGFTRYNCIRSGYYKICDSECPGPGMYCREHLTDDSFKEMNKDIKTAEVNLEDKKNRLEKMDESLRQWKIIELSGMDNNDEEDSIPKS